MGDRTVALVLCIAGLAAVGVFAWQSHRIASLEAENARILASNEILEESIVKERESLKSALRGLELEMDEYRLKKEMYESSVCSRHEALDRESEKAQECLRKELEADSSLERQMDLARSIVDEFSKKH